MPPTKAQVKKIYELDKELISLKEKMEDRIFDVFCRVVKCEWSLDSTLKLVKSSYRINDWDFSTDLVHVNYDEDYAHGDHDLNWKPFPIEFIYDESSLSHYEEIRPVEKAKEDAQDKIQRQKEREENTCECCGHQKK